MLTAKTEMPNTEAGKAETGRPALWAFLAGTFFGIGTLGPAPGTWGSAAAILIWAGVGSSIKPGLQASVLATMAGIVVAIGMRAAPRAARASGKKAPVFFVIDEVAGQWITLLFAPVT